jgi:alpha-methylacyl-CoA racemase
VRSARLTVLEIGSGMPVWHAGRILAALGADVLRVEPHGGIETWEGDVEAYHVLNATKRTLEADLSTDEGRELLRDRLGGVDILLLGVRPPTARMWRLRAEDLGAFPRLVHASLTAFGADGPYDRIAAHDVNALAVSGVAWVQGMADLEGQIAQATPLSDLLASLFLVIGVMDALRARDAGVPGPICREVSMADASLASLAAWGPWLLARPANQLDGIPFYGLYRSADDELLAVGAMERWQQERIAQRAGANGPVDHLDAAEVARLIRSTPAKEWLEFGAAEGVAISRVVTPWQALEDPHLRPRLARYLHQGDPWQRVLFPVVDPCQEDASGVGTADVTALLFPSGAAGRLAGDEREPHPPRHDA